MVLALVPTTIAGVTVLEHGRHMDDRGSLERLFAADELATAGMNLEAVHINLTRTTHPGTVKGLHTQRQLHAEAKIVTSALPVAGNSS